MGTKINKWGVGDRDRRAGTLSRYLIPIMGVLLGKGINTRGGPNTPFPPAKSTLILLDLS